MTAEELKSYVMFQTNNDAEDLGEFLPYLMGYINEGYDKLMMAYRGEHVSADGTYQPLRAEKSMPEVPDWLHLAIANYATWLVYRNGSTPKQNRGLRYLSAFEEALNSLHGMTADEKGLTDARQVTHFINIPI